MSGEAAPAGVDVRVVLVTAPGEEVAERMVAELVREGIVACGNIVPGALSIYRWQGRVEREREVLIVLKTTSRAVPRLLARVPALHPYEVPEILVFPIVAGHGPYLEWVAESVTTSQEKA